ncbi:MAG TPA: hypothetical protein VJN90_04235 [Candidatus Acidoferrales bacterium]|nr:hypothetical protein [Candidatus Acidoferrales bacterium]
MTRYWILGLLLTIPYSAVAQNKTKSLPMPPAISHGQQISKYACMFTEEPETSVDEYYYWRVVAYAEYGPEHKRYWSKALGTFRGTAAITSHNSESAGTGRAIGPVNETVYLGDAEKTCSQWKSAVHEILKRSPGK